MKPFRLSCALLVCLSFAGCVDSEADRDVAIMKEFGSNRAAARAKYGERWKAYADSDVSDERLLIATKMMETGTVDRDVYYRFIVDHLRKKDGTYRVYALRALGVAQGEESLGLLFDAYDSDQEPAAREALWGIRNRYEATKGVASLRDEQAYIEERAAQSRSRFTPPPK